MSNPSREGNDSVLHQVEKWAACIAGLGVLFMMLLGGFDVITTKVFSWPIPGAYELTETMMVASVFLALALSQREKRQIRVELFIERLSVKPRRMADALADLCSLVIYAFIAWYGMQAVWTSFVIGDYGSGQVRLPLWPAKLALAFGALLMCFQCAKDIAENVMAATRPRG